MNLSRNAKIVSAVVLIILPGVMYGGMALLGFLTEGRAGITPGEVELTEQQLMLWGSGHAHAGVWAILSIVLQILIDSAKLPSLWEWVARLGAPVGSFAVSAGFLGLAFDPGFEWVLYFAMFSLIASLWVTGIGLLKNHNVAESSAK